MLHLGGLDVNDLSHIINFNLPDDPEIYTHRSGRTGRAGRKGISIAIIHSRETRRLKEIERVSKITFEKQPVPTGEDICKKQLFSLIDKVKTVEVNNEIICLLYTSPSPRDVEESRMPSSA